MTGALPRLPVRTLSQMRCGSGSSGDGLGRRAADGGGGHALASEPVLGMPETFVGRPAVIASTTSCWVVFARS